MKRSILIRFTAGVVILLLSGLTYLNTGEVETEYLRYFSASVFVATLLLGLYDNIVWRWGWVQLIPGVPRSIRGTWHGTLKTLWLDSESGQPLPDKDAYLVVRQTATQLSTRLYTDESSSASSTGALVVNDGTVKAAWLYLNTPDASVEHRSRIHHGSTVVDVIGKPAQRLRGRYWTDRDSKGELEFEGRSRKLAEDYKSAQKLFSK